MQRIENRHSESGQEERLMKNTSVAVAAVCAMLLWMGTGQADRLDGPQRGEITDNGDGTITDHLTGLMWEKKTGTVGIVPALPSLHDVNNTYAWCSGTGRRGD